MQHMTQELNTGTETKLLFVYRFPGSTSDLRVHESGVNKKDTKTVGGLSGKKANGGTGGGRVHSGTGGGGANH